MGRDMPAQERARNAARKQYGAAADDPELFSALQNMDLNKRKTEQSMSIAGSQERRDQGTYDFKMGAAQRDERQQATLNLANGLISGIEAGEDPAALFDKFDKSGVLDQLGVSSGDKATLREQFIADPKVAYRFRDALTDPTKAAKVTAASAKSQQESADALSSAKLVQENFNDRIGELRSEDAQGAAKSIFGMPGVGKLLFKGGLGAFGSLPSSAAADYAVKLEALDGILRSAAFETLKGGGQITEKESEFARDAIANLSRMQSYDSYVEELDRIERYMGRVMDAAVRRAGGENVPEISPDGESKGSSAAPAKPTTKAEYDALPSGTVFTAPDGTVRRKP